MKVTLLAWTDVRDEVLDGVDLGWGVNVADALAEFAGRSCYQSWDKPNPATRDNVDYLANILKQQHYSVLEHASATFYVEGVSRALTHELIRHRHLSFSQLSQRFVTAEVGELVIPPAIENSAHSAALKAVMGLVAGAADQAYKMIVHVLEREGLGRKQAREAARAVLPNAQATSLVLTANMRGYREMIAKRWHVAADAEIQLLAGELLRQLREVAPNTFQDFPDKPFGSD